MNASGTPNTLNITGSFVMDDGGNPDYTGSQPLTINGNGNTVDMDDSGAFLNLFTSAAVVINDLTLYQPAARNSANGGRAPTSSRSTTSMLMLQRHLHHELRRL